MTRMSGRIEVVAADITDAPPPGRHDVAILRNVLQVMAPEQAERALANVFAGLAHGGAVHVLGWMVNDDGLRPTNAVLLNLLYLNLFEDGAAHPGGEIRRLLEEAGFTEVLRNDPPVSSGGQGFAMLSGRKP